MQLRFTPQKKRRKQLDAAEKLFRIIDKQKDYPYEFVHFKITGFHPKAPARVPVIKGELLAEDLRIFITKLSGPLAEAITDLSEKVHAVEELAAAFGVCKKTINRWRKRGLIARKFIFPDGKKRLGFLNSTVEKFSAENPGLVSTAESFSRLAKKQKQQIVRKAGSLVAKTNLSRHQIIKRITEDMDLCHETVRYTLLKHDKAHPDKAVFNRPSGILGPVQAAEIYKLYKQATPVKELARRFRRSRSSIHRIINIRRARAILAGKIEFIDSDEFLREDAEEEILRGRITSPESLRPEKVQPLQMARESLPDYLQTLQDTTVLNREQELDLFRRYNYLKYLVSVKRAGLKPSRPSGAAVTEIENLLTEAENIKKIIIEANLRLVVGVAGKHTISGANLPDLISEGNLSLMHAVEKFDYTRGLRFATLASWTITRDFARRTPAPSRPPRATAQLLAQIQQDLKTRDAVDLVAIERTHHDLVRVIENELNKREQYVILSRFGPVGVPIRKKTKTLKEIGDKLGLTKERVRQIELTALQKLRQSLSKEEFKLLTG